MNYLFAENRTAGALALIFEKHRNERVCIIGTMCCGKTTLVKRLSQYNCIDADDEIWPKISEEQTKILSRKPITKDILDSVCALMHAKISVTPGSPLFGITILDCEVVVYLDISLRLLKKHCSARGDTDFTDALFVKRYIEEDCVIHKKNKCFYCLKVTE